MSMHTDHQALAEAERGRGQGRELQDRPSTQMFGLRFITFPLEIHDAHWLTKGPERPTVKISD